MIKKISIIISILVVTVSSFSATNAQIDNFWRFYLKSSGIILQVFKTIRSSSDYSSYKSKMEEYNKKNAQEIASIQKNFTDSDAPAIMQRYMYHIQNNTHLGIAMKNLAVDIQKEYERIKKIPGGEEFLKSINFNMRPPAGR